MSDRQVTADEHQQLVQLPAEPIEYVAVVAALLSAGIHLFLTPTVMAFDQMTGILFALNGLGFLGGVLLFISRYWRRPLYLVASAYALATIVAYFAMGGPVNPMAIASKSAEAILVLAAASLYHSTG